MGKLRDSAALVLSGTGTHREQLGPTVMDFYTSLRTVFLGS